MRKVYRFLDNSDYWNKRWEDSGVDKVKFENMNIYPIKYTNMIRQIKKVNTTIALDKNR